MKKTPKRGRRAAKSGIQGEDVLHGAVIPYMPVINWKDFQKLPPDERSFVTVRQYPSAHPYRPDRTNGGMNDFMIFGQYKTIFVQVKNQNTSGTTDQKLSFAFDIAHYTLTRTPFDRFILVLLGDWWVKTPSIPKFCRQKAAQLALATEAGGRRVEVDVVVGPIELAALFKKLSKENLL